MKIAKASINWLISRKEIPSISKKIQEKWIYSPILVFKNQYNTPIWSGNTTMVPLWTCIVRNESIRGSKSISEIKYLSEEAPQELLQINAEFELFDGKRKVANGTILELICS